MIYGYLRVSTDIQDVENQKYGVIDKAKSLNLEIQQWIIDDGVSGTKEPEKRKLGGLLKKIRAGDVIITSELSRLGRSLFMVMRILEHCMKTECKVYTVKDGYELGNNITSKVLAFAFGLAAEIERDMISKRTKEALAKKRSEGLVLGRPVGTKNAKKKLDSKEKEIKKYLSGGLSFSAISRLLKVNRLTVSSICHERGWKAKDMKLSEKVINQQASYYPSIEIELSNHDLTELYRKHYSITQLTKDLNISKGQVLRLLKVRGLDTVFAELSNNQRTLIISKNQRERNEVLSVR